MRSDAAIAAQVWNVYLRAVEVERRTADLSALMERLEVLETLVHGIHKALQRRIEALERRLGNVPTIETDAETGRRLALCRAALEGHEPADLREDEAELFEKIRASVPIFRELIADETVGDDGEPAGADPPHEDGDEDEDGDDHPHRDDLHEDGELAWSP